MLENICFFHLRGGMDYRNMRPVHKAMMAMLKKMLLKKPESERSMEEKGLLAAYDRPVDLADRGRACPAYRLVQGRSITPSGRKPKRSDGRK